jgi:diacylglycerol kinase family enzyme
VFALTGMKVIPTLRLARQLLAKGPKGTHKQLVRDDDAPCLRVTSVDGPIASQFDGDYLGLRQTMTFRAVPDVLPVAAPPRKTTPELR